MSKQSISARAVRYAAALVMVLAAVLGPLAHAHACWFRPACLQESLPAAGETLPLSFAVIGIQRCVGASSISMSAERDGESTPVDFEQEQAMGYATLAGEGITSRLGFDVLRVNSTLNAGDTLVLRYVVQEDEDAGTNPVELRWPIGEAESLPSDLGGLNVRQEAGVIRVAANVSCQRDMMSSYADISLARAAELRHWLARLRFELRVDDAPWIYYDSLEAAYDTGSWESSLGRGRDRVVLGCEVEPHEPVVNETHLAPKAIEPGTHRVRMVGFMPTGEEISSEEISVDMQCAPDSPRALKAQLDACAAAKTGISASALASGGADSAACAAVVPGRAKASFCLAFVVFSIVLVAVGRRARR